MKRITTPWSYSKYSSWDQCNAKAGFRYGDGIAEPQGPASIRGVETHEAIELYAAFWGSTKAKKPMKAPKLPPHAIFFKARIDWMIEQGCIFEQRWFFDEKGRLVAVANREEERPPKHLYWVEMGIDSFLPPKESDKVLRIWDFKTGRVRNYDMQKEIYAMGGMRRFPWIRKVICENLYLDENTTSEAVFHADAVDELWEKWRRNVKLMTSDRKFAPNPSRLCGWCGHSRFKGGPCTSAQA